jgi:hypothetical protein
VSCAFKGKAGYREVFSDPANPLDDGELDEASIAFG